MSESPRAVLFRGIICACRVNAQECDWADYEEILLNNVPTVVPKGPLCKKHLHVHAAYPTMNLDDFLKLYRGNALFRQNVMDTELKLDTLDWKTIALVKDSCKQLVRVGIRVESRALMFDTNAATVRFKHVPSSLHWGASKKTIMDEHYRESSAAASDKDGKAANNPFYIARDTENLPRVVSVYSDHSVVLDANKIDHYLRSGQAEDKHKSLCDLQRNGTFINLDDIFNAPDVKTLEERGAALQVQRKLGTAERTGDTADGNANSAAAANTASLPASVLKHLGTVQLASLANHVGGTADQQRSAASRAPTSAIKRRLSGLGTEEPPSRRTAARAGTSVAGGAARSGASAVGRSGGCAILDPMLEGLTASPEAGAGGAAPSVASRRRSRSPRRLLFGGGGSKAGSVVGGDALPTDPQTQKELKNEENALYVDFVDLMVGEAKGQALAGVRGLVYPTPLSTSLSSGWPPTQLLICGGVSAFGG